MNMIREPHSRLLTVISVLLLLASCGGGGGGGGGPASIDHLTAVGLTKGDGEWEISWSATGSSITLNGSNVGATGTREVIASEPTTFTLRTSSGDDSRSASVTIGPVSGVTITDSEGRPSPFQLEQGEALQLVASVSAAGASDGATPNQSVVWESTDESVLFVDEGGLVEAVGIGTAQIHAISRQWTGRRSFVEVTSVRLPRIHAFTAIPLENGAGEWRIEWDTEADLTELNGSEVEPAADMTVSPSGVSEYVLVAANGPHTDTESFSLAPVSGFSVEGLEVVGVGETVLLADHVTVEAIGADVEPSQAVTYASSNLSIMSVEDGVLHAHAAGSATLSMTSLQDSGVSGTVGVQVVGAGVYGFSAPEAQDELEAGDTVMLEWRPVALTSLDLVTLAGNTEVMRTRLTPPTVGAREVSVPENNGTVNYRLEWTAAGGLSGRVTLWRTERRVLGWVCDRASQVVTFDDPLIEAEVRRIFSPPTVITCGSVQRQFAPRLNTYGQETRNVIHLNHCPLEAAVPRVQSLEGIQHLIHLARLELECNRISDVRRLESMTGLVEINFDNNDISDVTPLQGLANVSVLGLYNNNLTDISGLEGLSSLEVLYLSENHVKDLSPLSGLTNLEHVWLYDNCDEDGGDCLRDLGPLSGLNSLVSVVFHANAVQSLDFLSAAMTELELIIATGNQITDSGPLALPPALSTVLIDDNLITTLAPLVANGGFPSSEETYLWQRGTVRMPPEVIGRFEGHLAMGYNCLDPADPLIVAQVAELEDRGATVAGMDVPRKEECLAGAADAARPASIEQTLELLRRHQR